MIDIPTAEEYLDAQKSTASEQWMQGFDACRQLAIELGALDDLAAESQRLGLYDHSRVLVPCDKLKEMQEQIDDYAECRESNIAVERTLDGCGHLGTYAEQIKALREHLSLLQDRARAVVARWDGPKWADLPHTANFIHALRDAID